MRSKLTILLLTILLPLAAVTASADTHLTYKSQRDAIQMMGQSQPAVDTEAHVWFNDEAISRNDGATGFVITPGGETLLVINHDDKSYSELPLPIDFASLLPEEMKPMAEQMMSMMKMEVDVRKSEETKEINGWSTQRYDITLSSAMGMNIKMTNWVTEDIKMDLNYYRDLARAMSSLQPGAQEWVEKLLEIEGVTVLQETDASMMGNSFGSREELIKVEEAEAPAGTYGVPSDYEKKDFNPMAGAQ